MLAQALCDPFVPALVEGMDSALLGSLLDTFMRNLDLASPAYRALREWLDQLLVREPKRVPPNLRYLIATHMTSRYKDNAFLRPLMRVVAESIEFSHAREGKFNSN